MGKSTDLLKKKKLEKGNFHTKIGTIKDKNGEDLTEAEENKKRRQEYTEELYRKVLNDPVNHDGVVNWVMKIFFVEFFCVFLPPFLNSFCFC